MPVPVGSIVEVIVNTTGQAQQFMTVLHWVVTTAPTQQNAINSQNDLLVLLGPGGGKDIITPYRNACSHDLTFLSLSAQYIWPTRTIRSQSLFSLPGAIAGDLKATNIAVTVQKKSDLAGRMNRGAIHFPGVADGQYAAGIVTAPQRVLAATAADAMRQGVLETGGLGAWAAVIVHRTQPFAGTWVQWTTNSVKETLRTMRRRTVGLGI